MASPVEKRIAEAIANGEFDDLSGSGEPLSLDALGRDENLAHRLLVDHGFALPWIETRKDIEKDWTAAHRRLSDRAEWLTREGRPLANSAAWSAAVESFRNDVQELNRRVDDYNLSVPLPQFQRRRYDAEVAIERLISA